MENDDLVLINKMIYNLMVLHIIKLTIVFVHIRFRYDKIKEVILKYLITEDGEDNEQNY